MDFYIVDAFANALFGGNPAGVVLLDEGQDFPAAELMGRVAAELRYSETAFVKRISPGRYHTRYFTPVHEVDLCGHATIAAFYVLWKRGEVQNSCQNQTEAGDLRVQVRDGVVFMEMGKPVHQGTIASVDALCELYQVMGLSYGGTRMYARVGREPVSLPVERVSTGLADILLPVRDEAELSAIRPDFAALAALSRRYQAVGVHAFTLDGADGHIHCRNFAPRYAIDEEAATGTATGALIWYLRRRGMLGVGEQRLFVQGEAMGRPSYIYGRLDAAGEAVRSIEVGGSAVILASGRLAL